LSARLEPIVIKREREQEDLLIIWCILAYLIGLPTSAIEVARGVLLEVVPASYGGHSLGFHFWDGSGRSDGEGVGGKHTANFYENYAEDTNEKKRIGEPELRGQ